VKDHGLSIVRACKLLRLSRTAWYRRPGSRMERDQDVIEVLNEIVSRKPRWGFWKLHDRLRLEGHGINHKRLHRVYCAMALNLPRRTRRRIPLRPRRPLLAPRRAQCCVGCGLHGRRLIQRSLVPNRCVST
jgi:putative transposase